MFDATQLFYVIQSELPSGCIVTLPLKKQQELLEMFRNCLDNEMSLLDKIFKCEENNRSPPISDMDVDLPCDSEKKNLDCPKQAIQRKRQQVSYKRKLAQMLMQDEENLTIDQHLYEQYYIALQETNSVGELLAKIYLTKHTRVCTVFIYFFQIQFEVASVFGIIFACISSSFLLSALSLVLFDPLSSKIPF